MKAQNQSKLSPQELSYYQRQIILKEIGLSGQVKLKSARVLCVGVGGLGCPLLLCLTHIGIGHITMVDGDQIDLSNLHRQVLYKAEDIGESKVWVAQNTLVKHNPHIEIKAIQSYLSQEYQGIEWKDYDLIIDGTDDLSIRYFLNQQSVTHKIPYLYAALDQWQGQVAIFHPKQKISPCFECLFPKKDQSPFETCRQKGMLASVSMLVATYQANIVAQHFLGIFEYYGQLFQISALDFSIFSTQIPKAIDCICQDHAHTLISEHLSTPSSSAQVRRVLFSELEKMQEEIEIIDLRDILDQEEVNLHELLDGNLKYKILQITFHQMIHYLLDLNIHDLLKPQKHYYFLCQSNHRSQLICDYLIEQGFDPHLLCILSLT